MKKFYGILAVIMVFAIAAAVFQKDAVLPVVAENELNVKDNSEAMKHLQDEGIIEGYEDGKLHPEYKLTRAEFAKILNKTYKDVPVHEVAYVFSDLEPTHWAYEDIQRACNAGWLKGFDDDTFRPDDNITFEQAVTVICRCLGVGSYYGEEDYPRAYISAAIEYSLSDGVDALIGDKINRGQAARLIVNALNYEKGQIEDEDYGYTSAVKLSSAASGGSGGGSVNHYNKIYSEMAVADTASVINERYFVEPSIIHNTEEYSHEDENVFKKVVTSPLSTFSIDADTASYSNMRRFILNGNDIPHGAIRSEELINYFDYEKAEIQNGQPFGVKYAVGECPWNEEHNLAMITVSGEELTEPKPSNIVFLIDVSGSMYDYNKLPLVKQALSLLLEKLDEKDKISIVTYASGTRVALEPTTASDKEKIMGVINGLRAGGSTAGAQGITLAYEQAEKFKCDGNNRVILCTDGDFNVGISSESELEKLISEKRDSGIFLSVLGFGMGNYKDNKMEILADKGNGNYAYIDNLREAKKVLADDMSKTIYTIAKDVKLQVEFNPEVVSQYRLIGYENRILNNEDFDNDKKDAGELGAGATVTVLYEIIPSDGSVSSGLKYQKTEGTGSDELMTVKVRYKLPENDESVLAEYPVAAEVNDDTSDDFRFAAAVAELGMILNDSDYKGNSTFDSVIELAKGALGKDEYGIRCEFVQLVDLLRYSKK